jgi:hypothetical protein
MQVRCHEAPLGGRQQIVELLTFRYVPLQHRGTPQPLSQEKAHQKRL